MIVSDRLKVKVVVTVTVIMFKKKNNEAQQVNKGSRQELLKDFESTKHCEETRRKKKHIPEHKHCTHTHTHWLLLSHVNPMAAIT